MTINKIMAAGAVGVLLTASAVPAQAGDGGAIAAGVIGGLATGAILGGGLSGGYGYGYPSYSYSAPAYGYGYRPSYYGYSSYAPVYRSCHRYRHAVYDEYGDFAGYETVRKCY